MIGWFEALVLGIVQGVTEYLPVSSSGHLVIGQALFGMTEPALSFDIILHLGTLVAVLWYYGSDIKRIISGTVFGIGSLRQREGWSAAIKKHPGLYSTFLIILGSIPTALIGLTFRHEFQSLFGSPPIVGMMLLVTGATLLLTRFTTDSGREMEQITVREALIIGFVQGLAITPGISRAGSTICAALFLGIGREAAARYSFLLSLPAILGASLLQIDAETFEGASLPLGIGFFAAAITGCLCLMFLVALVKKGKLDWFSWYCFLMGGLVIFGLSD